MFLAFGPYFIVQFALFALAVFYMLQINVLLTLLALVTIPFVYRIGVTMRRWMFPLSWLTMARTADIATIVDENINGVRVVKSFAGEKEQIGKLAESAGRLRWVAVKTMWARARYGPLMENLTRFGEASIILYGGILVIDHRIGPGDLLVFLTYLALLQAPFRMLGFILMMQQRAAASAQRIYEVLDEPTDIRDAPGCGRPGGVPRRRRDPRRPLHLQRRADRVQRPQPHRARWPDHRARRTNRVGQDHVGRAHPSLLRRQRWGGPRGWPRRA